MGNKESGGLIKAARREAGLTQEDAARLLGTNRRALQSWEDGVRVPKAGYNNLVEKIKAIGILSGEGRRCLLEGIWSMDDVLAQYKHDRVQTLSEWGRYGATYEANRKRIPGEIWNKLPAEDLARLVDAFKAAYDDGVAYGKGEK